MDFSRFDNRGPAETGQRLELKDPSVRDGEPLLDGKKNCAVIVRGSTARSVQMEMRKRQKAKMTASKNSKAEEARVMEDVHSDLCEAAAPLIVGFENVERDGRPLTAESDDIKWFLDLTFPIMGVKEDEDGEPILNGDGQVQFQMRNNPFAKQITDFSSEMALNLGNGKPA
jgi:hypothetical protein